MYDIVQRQNDLTFPQNIASLKFEIWGKLFFFRRRPGPRPIQVSATVDPRRQVRDLLKVGACNKPEEVRDLSIANLLSTNKVAL